MQEQKGQLEILGEVTCPSGILLLLDFGLLDLWTHEKAPLIRPGILNEEALSSANNGCDFHIEGPDALLAGKKFGRQTNPLYLYDIPSYEIEEMEESFRNFVGREGLNARLCRLSERVPPRKRVDQTLLQGKGAGEVFLHGIHVIAVGDLPKNRSMKVQGTRMACGDFSENWREISLLVSDHNKKAQSRKIGHVAVDMARLMFCDADAIGKWQHEDSIDGLADFVFWGKDSLRLAKKFDAKLIEGNIYGFQDRPVQELAALALEAQKHLEQHHLVAALDFRPHSDHWRMLKTLARTHTESGVIDLAGALLCGFMTSWGDGFFPVYLDKDREGNTLAIRIELGTEETLRGMRMVNGF